MANKNMRQKGYIGSSSHGLVGIDWESWTGRFHLDRVTMVGHSFGGATTVEVLRRAERFNFISQGIVYDLWGAPIHPPEGDDGLRASLPLLCVNSEAFVYWPQNFNSVERLCQEIKDSDELCWMLTIRGSVHVNQSDFSILYPRISSLFLKMTVNPRRAMDLNINASLEFLKVILPQPIAIMIRVSNEHLLDVPTTHDLPNENKPVNSKWIAARLRIPNEVARRLTPAVVRRFKRRKKMALNLPKDRKGHVLGGLQNLELGSEIWMHVKPSREELAAHGVDIRRSMQRNSTTDTSSESD